MHRLLNQIRSSNKFNNIVKIASGTLGGQIISIISIPILTRIYGVEILGIWALLNAICLFVNSFSDLGLNQTIMIGVKEDHKDKKLYEVISTITFAMSLISTLIVCSFFFFTTNEAGLNIIFLFVYLFLSMFFLQQTQTCYSWINKRGNYNVLMKNPVISHFSIAFFSIALGLLGFAEYGYFVGWLGGKTIALLHMKRHTPKHFLTFEFKKFQSVISQHASFVKYQLPTNLLSQLKNQIPIFFIQSFFGIEMVGFYSITLRILGIPVSLLGNAFGRVFFHEASDIASTGKSIGVYTLKNMRAMMKLALIPMIVFISFGGDLLVFFLGTEWRMAGEMFVIISFQSYFRLLLMSSQGITAIMKKQHFRMIMSITQILLSCLAFLIINVFSNDILIALAISTIGEVIIHILFFSKMFDVMDISPKKYLKSVLLNSFLIFSCSFLIRYLMLILIP